MTGSCFAGRKISGDPGHGRLPVFIDIKRNGSPAGNGEKADLYIGSPLPKRYDTQIKINVENEPVKKMYRDHVPIEKIDRLYRDVR